MWEFFHYLAGMPQSPSSNSAPLAIAQHSMPPTVSKGSVGGQQDTPELSLGEILSMVYEMPDLCVCFNKLNVLWTCS